MSDSTKADPPVTEAAPAPELPPEPAETPKPQELPESPGCRLREAREAQGLSIASVAQALKFGPRQIESLEAGELTALAGGTTFVRGFVRCYAKFLKLDSGPLLAMLDARLPKPPPDVPLPQNMGSAMPASPLRKPPPIAVASVALLLMALVFGVWHFPAGPESPQAASGSIPPAAADPAPVLQPQTQIEPEADASAKAEQSASPPDARPLVFEMRESAWIEVADANQQILLTGEYPAGSRQSVMGKPPLHLVIGNASRVGLSFDGRPMDLAPHTRADVARLTIE